LFKNRNYGLQFSALIILYNNLYILVIRPETRNPSFWLKGTQRSHYSNYYAALYVDQGLHNGKVWYTSTKAQIIWGEITINNIKQPAWKIGSKDLPVVRFVSVEDTLTPLTVKKWIYLRNHKTPQEQSSWEEAFLEFKSLSKLILRTFI